MYDRLRLLLQADVAARQGELAAAQAVVTATEAVVQGAQAAVAAAQAALDQAVEARTAAQSAHAAAAAVVASRQAALDVAQAAFDEWEADRPQPGDLPGGRPNVQWFRRLAELDRAAAAARQALTAAQVASANAGAAATAAASTVTARQSDLADRQAAVGAAQVRRDAARTAAGVAAGAVDFALRAVADLDARAARAAGLSDVVDLAAFADEEQVEVSRLRAHRLAQRTQRHAVDLTRDGILADHDADIEALAVLAQALHGWSDAALPDPAQLAGVLDGIVATSRAQRAGAPRVDDLAGQAAAVGAALARLQVTVGQATARRDQASAALDAAIADVQAVNESAP